MISFVVNPREALVSSTSQSDQEAAGTARASVNTAGSRGGAQSPRRVEKAWGPTKMAPRVHGGCAGQEDELRPGVLVAVAVDPVRVDLWSRAWRQESWAGLQGQCGAGLPSLFPFCYTFHFLNFFLSQYLSSFKPVLPPPRDIGWNLGRALL